MFNITICSNNYEEVKILSNYLEKFSIINDFKYKLLTYNNIEKLTSKSSKTIDILFIDTDLEDKQTFEETRNKLNKSINKNTQVVYMCEVVNFMLNGFALKDHRYLLKPLKYESVEEELLNIIKSIKVLNAYTTNEPNIGIELYNLLNGLSTKDIYYIKSAGNNSIAITSTSSIKIPHSLRALEQKLDPKIFVKCNDDCIINLRRISKIGRYFVISKNCEIAVSEDLFETVKNKLKVILNII